MTQGYLSYTDFMAEVAGKPIDMKVRNQRWAELGITTKDVRWDGKNNEGAATFFYQHGKPLYMAWYEWNVSEANFKANLEQELGKNYRLINVTHAGNGHYSAYIEVT